MSLSDVLTQLRGPCPCDSCGFTPRCAAERLACTAYARFVAGRADWTVAPRVDASREIYRQAVGEPVSLPKRRRARA